MALPAALGGMKLLDYIMAGLGIKGLFGGGGGGEERGTFEGESSGGVSVDPRDLLARGVDTTENLRQTAMNRANKPIQLRSAYVQQPPTFTGGGLPMPIGVTGADPALAHPGLQVGEGYDGAGPDQGVLDILDMIKGDTWRPGR